MVAKLHLLNYLLQEIDMLIDISKDFFNIMVKLNKICAMSYLDSIDNIENEIQIFVDYLCGMRDRYGK